MSISDLSPENTIEGGTDGTAIGNEGDNLKVTGAGGSFPIKIDPTTFLTDPFGRLRTSASLSLFEWKFIHGLKAELFDEQLTGGATGNVNVAEASYDMSTTTAINDKIIVSSRRYMRYAPGKGQLMFFSGNFHDFQTNVTKCLGMYDSDDGKFFMLRDSTAYVVLRSSTSGSVVDTEVAQSNWNIDTFDGSNDANNPSGIQLDFSKQQIFVIDYQWLGSGVIRYGFQLAGGIQYCHRIENANNKTAAYSRTGNLPVRAEMVNHGTPPSAGNMHLTCVDIVREDGKDLVTSSVSISTEVTEINLSSTFTHLASFRMRSGSNRNSLLPLSFEIIMTSGTKYLYYELVHNATLGSPTWTTAGIISEYAIGTDISSVTGGTKIAEGHINVSGSSSVSGLEDILGDFHLGRDIAGNSDTLSLRIKTSGGSAKVIFNAAFEEEV